MRAELKQRSDVARGRHLRRQPAQPAARGAARRARRCSASTRACAPAASAPRSTRPASSSARSPSTSRRATRSSRRRRTTSPRSCSEHTPRAIAVGNGTGGREAEAFVQAARSPRRGVSATRRTSCRSTRPARACTRRSDVAREEFPELDLTMRGAISIARRLQDPLAELVKIEPKSIGVGQYQHDVHQPLLAQEARRRRRELRQPRRRRAQHRERAAARLRRRHRQVAREEDRRCTATSTARSRRARSCSRCRASGPRRSSRRRASCASAAARTRSTRARCTPSATRSSSRWRRTSASRSPELVGNARARSTRSISAKYVSGDVGEPTLRDIVAELGEAGPRSARRVRAAEVPRRRHDDGGPQGRAWCSRASSPT